MLSLYPDSAVERDRWIVSRRGPRAELDPYRPSNFFVEDERSDSGEVVPIATKVSIFAVLCLINGRANVSYAQAVQPNGSGKPETGDGAST